MTRKKKASLNIISSTILEFTNVVNSLILPRLILRNFGSSYNGITSSATQFFSLISILTLGVTLSTRAALYKPLADNDIKRISAVVRATEKYMQRVGIILAIYIAVLALIYPIVIDTGFSFWDVSSLIIIVGMSSFAEYFFGITYRTFLLADQSVYVVNLFSVISVFLNLILTYLFIRFGYSIQIVKLASASVFVLKPILQNIYVKKKYRIDKSIEPDYSALKKRGDAMMHSVANIVHDNTDLVVLTFLTNVKIVSVYTVYNLVFAALKRFQNVFTSGAEPIFGDMWAKGENESIKRNLSVYEFFISAFSSVVYSVAYVMIISFVSLYTKNVTDINYLRPEYSAVLTFAFLILSFRTPYVSVIYGIGHFRETRDGAILEAAINLLISILLVIVIPDTEHKMIGVAIGTLAANLFRTIQYAVYIDNNVVHRGKRVFAFKIIWTIINMIMIIIPSNIMVNNYFNIQSWKMWLLIAITVSIYGMLIVVVSSTIFYRKDFIYALNMGKEMIARKNPFKNN